MMMETPSAPLGLLLRTMEIYVAKNASARLVEIGAQAPSLAMKRDCSHKVSPGAGTVRRLSV